MPRPSDHPSILLAAVPGAMTSFWTGFIAPLAESWPDASGRAAFAERPRHSIDQAVEMLTGDRASEFDGAFIVFDEATQAKSIDLVVELLRAANLPAVIVVSDPSHWRHVGRDGLVFESHDASPAKLAAILYGLSLRQPAVREFTREIELTRRCEMAIRAEMERMHEELQVAATVQREFVTPPAPASALLDHAMIFKPVNYVSGDVCCVRDLGGDKISFFLADAAGHGMSAALLTMVLAQSLETISQQSEAELLLNPMDVLSRLNACVCSHRRDTGWFATAVYGVFDARTGQVCVGGAGHPPPLVIGRPHGGSRRELTTLGPLLGVDADAEFNQTTWRLEPGQALVVYSDGLECVFPDAARTEASHELRERPHLIHLERLEAEMADVLEGETASEGPTPAEQVAQRLAWVLEEQAGSLHQVDDITALVLRSRRRPAAVRKAA